MTTLPNLGNGIDYRPFPKIQDTINDAKKDFSLLKTQTDQAKQAPLYRIAVDRNINPEVTKLIGEMLGGKVRNEIDNGNLNFNIEVPGFNSNRAYFGLNWKL